MTGWMKGQRRWLVLITAGLMISVAACSDADVTGTGGVDPSPDAQPENEPELGQSDFVSADGRNGEASQDGGNRDENAAPDAEADDGDGAERSVEEGDIYRVLDDGRILNLNAYRGLQIIDFTDIENPRIEGRLQVTGHPVELYVVGDRAFVLMNNWRGYWRSQHDTRPETYQGGLLVAVDISDRTQPRITGKARVPGWIQTSRLTRGGGQQALYAVTSYWGERINEEGDTESGTFTYVKSFSVTESGEIRERTEINLGGYVGAIQATTDRLTVARVDWQRNEPRSRISIIDISNPDGTMIEGDQVEVRGYVHNKHNMNVHGDVLRIVSGSTWGGTRTNHVQTYDATDINDLVEIDHATFGDGENLFGTLFMGNKAFFVTYRQVDPFHAFEITDEGEIFERAEYIISGWNNFFRPVFGGDRLLGIGVNDEDGRTMAVSLYDTTDLSNPEPFIARAEVESTWSWSEANWDDRAFSIIEDAVEIAGPEGERETGLVLLPFSGWDRDTREYFAAVQVFTFSDSTLTQRGVMHHGTPVRRSFPATDNLTANLSEAELSLFDTTDPAAPTELGRVELAPNYSDFLVFGDHGLRVKSRDYYSMWYRNEDADLPLDKLEIIRLGEDPDMAEPTATIEVPSGASLKKVGDMLVATTMARLPETDPVEFETTIRVFDLARPQAPVLRGELVTNELQPSYGYYGYYEDFDCFDCWYGYNTRPTSHVVGESLVFADAIPEQTLLGREEVCHEWPMEREYDYNNCWDREGDPQACTYITGSRVCRSLENAPAHCTGEFYRCNQDDEGQTECEEIPYGSVRTRENCYDYERYRHWQHYKFHVLDLSNPGVLELGETIAMPIEEESVGLVAEGSDLYVSYKVPTEVENDPRPFVRYYVKRLDLSNPAAPSVGSPINVPGELLAVHNEGETLITQDFVWGNEIIEAAINRLSVRDGRAYLDARRRFVDQQVHNVAIDDRGNLLVSHRVAWRVNRNNNTPQENLQQLTILDANHDALPIRSRVDVDIWAQLKEARAGRALFAVPGGLLVLNLDDTESPFAQSYFPVRGWPQGITVTDEDIYFAAGRFGLYRFDMNENNLDLF